MPSCASLPRTPRAAAAATLAASFAAIACLVAAVPVVAQRIVLPDATGALSPGADWVVLRTAELERPSRSTDPTAEPARTLLLQTIAELRRAGRLREHALFHQPGGSAGTLRLVNAWSAAGGATAAELAEPDRVAAMRAALEPELQQGGAEVRYLGDGGAGLFAVGSAMLRFAVRRDGSDWVLRHHAVPAGERLQYFDAIWSDGDPGGEAAVDDLLRTFDGAREGSGDPVLRNMLLAGLAGAVAGVGTALLRRRRLQRLLRTAAPAGDEGADGTAGSAPPER